MAKFPRWSLMAVLLAVFLAPEAYANTYIAASCNTSDVQAALNLAADGDTVIIPNGSCTWTYGLTTSLQITLTGESVGGVVITDADTNSSDNLLTINIGSSFHTTIANLNFLPGTGTGTYITVQGTGLVPLMHDMDFNIPNFQLQHAVDWHVTGGVIWNTTFESTYNLNGTCGQQVGSDSGSLSVKSNKNWDDASTMGTLDTNGDQNLYIEDSTFNYVGQAPDMDDNARVAIRHTTFINTSGALIHGPTSTYGGRSVEFYNDTFTYSNTNRSLQRWYWGRGGTAVITNNSVDADTGGCYGPRASWVFIVESATRSTSHGCCTSYACFHQPGSGSDGTSGHTFLSTSQTPYDSYQQSDPVYIWNNTGTGQGNLGLNDDTSMGCSSPGADTAAFFVQNRDYFLDTTSSPTSGAKPGWAPYPYPHPLHTGTPGPNSPAVPQGKAH